MKKNQKKVIILWIYEHIPKGFNKFYHKNNLAWKRLSEDTQEMPQSWSTTFPRFQKKERQGIRNDKTITTYEITNAQRTATEVPPWNGQLENFLGA